PSPPRGEGGKTAPSPPTPLPRGARGVSGRHGNGAMLDYEQILLGLGLVVVGAPFVLVLLLGLTSLLDRPLAERSIDRVVQVTIVTGLLASVGVLALMLVLDTRRVVIDVGRWVETDQFHFEIKFVFDRLSVPF